VDLPHRERVVREAVDERAELAHRVRDEEEAVEEVADEEVERGELELGAEERLVRARVRARDEETVGAEDEGVVLRDVKGGARVADDLLQLVLLFALVHLLLRREVRRDLVRDDEVDLVAVRRVAVKDEREELALLRGEDGVDDGGGVDRDVDEEARERVEREVVLDAVHDRLDLHALEHRAVRVHRAAEGLDLHDALLFRDANLRLEVDVLRQRLVEDVDGREARVDDELGPRGVVVDERREEAALDALHRPEVLVHLHDLVRAEGDELRNDDGD
jgi:hypothetical protein